MDNRTIEEIRDNETRLIKKLIQKENIIKEVREYTELFRGCLDYDKDIRAVRLCKDILEILDKGE